MTEPIGSDQPRAVTIARARLRDLRGVAAVQRRAFRPGLAYNLSALVLLWLLPTATFLVARDARTGAVLGCCIADREGGNVRIVNIAVDPDARRQGIGTALLRGVGEALPDGEIELIVEEHNEGAQALYRREGFVQTGFARDYYGIGRHGIWMRLRRPPSEPARRTIDV
jgi:ribosomal-protein-alanine N-acetyltransferase